MKANTFKSVIVVWLYYLSSWCSWASNYFVLWVLFLRYLSKLCVDSGIGKQIYTIVYHLFPLLHLHSYFVRIYIYLFNILYHVGTLQVGSNLMIRAQRTVLIHNCLQIYTICYDHIVVKTPG